MGLFGKQGPAADARAARVGLWARERSPYALASLMLGIVAAMDVLTMVLGLALGAGAILCGLRGLSEIRAEPTLKGIRLCRAGIGLGAAAALVSLLLWMWFWTRHATAHG